MTYTNEFNEFEKWAKSEGLDECDFDVLRIGLSAFAKLVREEAALRKEKMPFIAEDGCLWAAFNAICERFGLGREG